MRTALVEREAQLERLRRATEDARAGAGGVVVVEGPAGIGKSRLLQAHRAEPGLEDALVLTARGGELELDLPYSLVRQLFELPLAGLGRKERERVLAGPAALALPAIEGPEDLDSEPGAAAAARVRHGLFWLCTNLAADGLLVLHVDDVHWADAASLEFLEYLSRRVEGASLLVVAAARTGDEAADRPLVARLLADPAVTTVRPRALAPGGVGALVRATWGTEPDHAFVAACHRATGGNPFLLGELIDALHAEDVQPDARAAARVEDFGPRTVSRAILLRLAGAGASVASVARAVAVLGDGTDLRHVAAVAGMDVPATTGSAGRLAALNLLDEAPAPSFIHPLVRASLYRDIAPGERAELHGRAASVLRAAGATPALVAHHLAALPPASDSANARELQAAGMEAYRTGAVETAARLLHRALAEPPPEELRGRVLLDLGRVEASAREVASSLEHLREAAGLLEDPEDRGLCIHHLAWNVVFTEGVPAAAELLEAELGRVGGSDPELELRLLAHLAGIGNLSPEVAPRIADRLRAHAGLAGASSGERLVLSGVSQLGWFETWPAARVADVAERAWGDGAILGDTGIEDIEPYGPPYALVMADQPDRAVELADRLIEHGRAQGSAMAFGASSGMRAWAVLRRGDLAGAESDAAQALAALAELAPLDHQQPWSFVAARALTEARTRRGDLDGAQRALEETGFGGEVFDLVPLNRLLLARASLRVAQGRDDQALADLEELARRDAAAGVDNPADPRRLVLAGLLAARGDDEGARRAADEQLDLARRWGTPTSIGTAAAAVATLRSGAARVEGLEAAAATLATSPDRLAHAEVLVLLGRALRVAGRRADANEPLTQGLELARDRGARPLAERAIAELETLGARPRRLAFSGVEDLTASERRIAEMAAGGQSNREIAQALFVTAKTVENHLGRVYGKLGIRSRRELASSLAPA